ncbi:MAG: transcription elongation factor GreA [Dehalococcoidia bacterium]|nr:MAG: transcription elongation factor GreA [Dehalococcoidia bacterium]
MNVSEQKPSLGEAASRFLASLSAGERGLSQQEIYKFVRWFGWERPLTRLTPPEVANYAGRLSLSDTSYLKKFELIRAFLLYATKEGWCRGNLATHLKTKLTKAKLPSSARQASPAATPLTKQGYEALEAELISLKDKRSQAIDEIRRAAADKDFRENAPLEAAREERGQLEGRIRELEAALESAVIMGKKETASRRVSIGDSIILSDEASGEELSYTIVSPREVNPARGRISSVSPIGRAILGKAQGETIEVAAPAGRLSYHIKEVKRE